MTRDLRQRARASSIALEYHDAHGETVRISDLVLTDLLAAVGASNDGSSDTVLPPVLVVTPVDGTVQIEIAGDPTIEHCWRLLLEDGQLREGRSSAGGTLVIDGVPYGYHTLSLSACDAEAALIVTPGKCYMPDSKRRFGISLQLYLLQSEANFGIGDFGDLARLASIVGGQGCDIVGVNPLHQMFLDVPEQASPYSPVSRYFLNVLYIDLRALPEWHSKHVQKVVTDPGFAAELKQCREAPLVDYSAVTRLKLMILRAAYAAFQMSAEQLRCDEFGAFVEAGGKHLRNASLFQVLRSEFASRDAGPDGRWPAELRDAASGAVAQFAMRHRDEIYFLTWAQWLADTHLAEAARACTESGMTIGIYRDLAVGCDSHGAETWSDPQSFLAGVRVGAPPDILNPAGQNWGLPPFNPMALRRQGYRPFRDLVRANMRHAGGLRIDHVMGLKRLYCIPEGRSAGEGAYIEYPLDDMLGIIALESHRNRCIVVGEDLGTVPVGFRERLEAANVLSYRVLMFEQNADGFIPPEDYPEKSVAVAGSHDMATLAGWFVGTDIELKEKLGRYPEAEEVFKQRDQRRREKQVLEALLRGGKG